MISFRPEVLENVSHVYVLFFLLYITFIVFAAPH